MAHTNSTTNYNLPQFISTDKPAWLSDINGAFYDIDEAIKDVADAADPSTILDQFYPIGSEYVTSTNVQPAIGGGWILVEKELSTLNRSLNDPSDFATGAGFTVGSASVRRAANQLQLSFSITSGTFSDTTANILTLDPTALGVTQFGVTGTNVTFLADNGNVLCVFQLDQDGLLTCRDAWVIKTTGCVNSYTGGLNAFTIDITVASEHMLDAACDRFIWKRTS